MPQCLSKEDPEVLKRPNDDELKAISQTNTSTFGSRETKYLKGNLDRLIQMLVSETDEVLVRRYQGAVEVLQDFLKYRTEARDIIEKRKKPHEQTSTRSRS